jgi:hypothetical protein
LTEGEEGLQEGGRRQNHAAGGAVLGGKEGGRACGGGGGAGASGSETAETSSSSLVPGHDLLPLRPRTRLLSPSQPRFRVPRPLLPFSGPRQSCQLLVLDVDARCLQLLPEGGEEGGGQGEGGIRLPGLEGTASGSRRPRIGKERRGEGGGGDEKRDTGTGKTQDPLERRGKRAGGQPLARLPDPIPRMLKALGHAGVEPQSLLEHNAGRALGGGEMGP